MKNVLFLSCFLLVSQACLAQKQNTPFPLGTPQSVREELVNLLSGGLYSSKVEFDGRYRGIEGSPFLWENWSDGVLWFNDTMMAEKAGMQYKFEAYHNEIWVKDATAGEIVLHSHQFLGAEIRNPQGQMVKFRKFFVPEANDPHRFYRVVFEGKNYKLIQDNKKILKKADFVDRGIVQTGSLNDRFEDEMTYWMIAGSKLPKVVKLKKSQITANCLNGKSKPLEQYCKNKGYKNKMNETEVIDLLRYMDGLPPNSKL